jgi:hypothetical protein
MAIDEKSIEASMPLFFWGGGLSIFVLRSKRMDMLKGITWGQFSSFLLVVAVVYYLYVLLTYYRSEASGWIRRKGGDRNNSRPGAAGDRIDGAPGDPGDQAAAGQAELFEQEAPAGGGDEGFQQMQRTIAVLRQVIMQGIESKLDRGNLLDHIKEVLKENRQLRKTEYAETINNFLIRVCSSELALELGEAELGELWK